MSSLKRSQKLCPKCGGKNYIRQFFCKFCNFEFPKRDKSQVQNSSIEQFFFKMPNKVINDDKNKNKVNKNNIGVINLDEDEEKEDKRSRSVFRKKKEVEDKQDKILDKNALIEINKKNLSQFFELLEKKGINNNLFIEKKENIEKYIQINYEENIIQKKIKSILYQTASIFPFPSFDICSVDGINSYYLSILFREEEKINTITNIIVYFNKDMMNPKIKIYQNETKEDEENIKLLYNQDINTKIISCNDDYLLYAISYKNILQCNLIKFSKNLQKNLELFQITSKNLIIKSDFEIVKSKNQIRVLLSNSENTLYYYLYDTNENITLIGIYDYLFLYKITDIKFMNVNDTYDEPWESFYFMVSSRDGLIYFLNNFGNIIFQHKTNQTWITQCIYDSYHNILLFLTNFDDKMVGAKFNVYKEPIIKRIPNTNNPYCMQMTPFMDKIFYLNDKGEIYSLSTFILEDMFKAAKLKKKSDYKPHFVYKVEDYDKSFFLNKFKLIGNNKSISYDKEDKNILLALFYSRELKFVYV